MFIKKIWSKFFGPTIRGLSEKDIKNLVRLAVKKKDRYCSKGFQWKRFSCSSEYCPSVSMNLLGQYLKYSKSCWATIEEGHLILDFKMKDSSVFYGRFYDGDNVQLRIYLEGVEKDYFKERKKNG